ncbi:hypothetical protein BDP27DRAFT_600637 [Rhodocollybia butyracea]|uniref:RNase III domain-containing protein n=1 Tax=Rhodocollybia butyracea TaxID=206335 RepID=A0A9P5Q9J8_9AGAR|nr:hypothetical protein BDP27DRAFT_600637 [Rhodocollybia butyracea]
MIFRSRIRSSNKGDQNLKAQGSGESFEKNESTKQSLYICSLRLELATSEIPFIKSYFQEASPQTIINTGWKFDPPKVLSDVFESIIGAVLIDSGYNYEIVEGSMEDILGILFPAATHSTGSDFDSYSELQCQVSVSGSEKAKFRQARFSLEYPPDFPL